MSYGYPPSSTQGYPQTGYQQSAYPPTGQPMQQAGYQQTGYQQPAYPQTNYPPPATQGMPPMAAGVPPVAAPINAMPSAAPMVPFIPPGYPARGTPLPSTISTFCLWNLHPTPRNFLQCYQDCIYQMPPSIKASWWYQLLNVIPMDQSNRIYQWFIGVDKDKSGSLDINELMTGDYPGGIRLLPQAALRMMRIFDTDFNGHISFFEFMAMYKFMEICYYLFITCDKNRNGTLEPNEIKPALAKLGFFVHPRTAVLLHRLFAHGAIFCDMNCWITICSFMAQLRSAYQVVLMNPFYGKMKPFNQSEFGKFIDMVSSLLE